MTGQHVTHVGFSDESHWNIGRFRALGLVTLPVQYLRDFNEELREELRKSGIQEFEWKKLRRAKERFAAQQMCMFAIRKALNNSTKNRKC